MSQFGCSCGKIISLVVSPNPNEGWIIRDQDLDEYYEKVGQDVAGFIQAVVEGNRLAWIAQRYNFDMGDEQNRHVRVLLTISDAEVVHDIMLLHLLDLSIFQCPYCGRLWVQSEPRENRYRSFKPEGEWKDTLAAYETEEEIESEEAQ